MDILREINEKYSMLEAEVNSKLEKVNRDEEKLAKLLSKEEYSGSGTSSSAATKKVPTDEEEMYHNANVLKCLEKAKARLRSRSTYTPVEQILQKSIENYKRALKTSVSGSSNNSRNEIALK